MADLLPMVIEKKEVKAIIVCPATWDGMACSTILTREWENVEYQLFCKEENIASVFDYPAIIETPEKREIVIAGLPISDSQVKPILKAFTKSNIEKITWFSHHFWNRYTVDLLSKNNFHFYINTTFSTSALLLTSILKITDKISKMITTAISKGVLEDDPATPWLYLFLAIQEDLYEIRHALKSLYLGKPGVPDPDLVKKGHGIFRQLTNSIDSNRLFIEDFQEYKGVVLGLPISLRPHYNLLALLVAKKLQCQLILLFFDSSDQVLIIRGIKRAPPVDFFSLSDSISIKTNVPVRHYNKDILLVGPPENKNMVELIDKIKAAISN